MAKASKKLTIVSLVVLPAILGGCFLAPQGQNTNQPVNANNTNQAVNTNQGGQGEIDTSDLPSEDLSQEGWKTYRNEEYGFEFEYPDTFSVKEWAYKTPNWELLLYIGQNQGIGDGAVEIGVEKNIKHLDDWLILFPQDSISIRNVMIGSGNYQAKEVKVNFYSVDSKVNALNYFIENSGKLFRISYNLNRSVEVDENIFKTILSSLMFIN